MRFDPLRQSDRAVSARLEGVVPNCAPTVEAIFNNAHVVAEAIQLDFQHARPALLEWQAPARIRNDSPGQRIGINEDLVSHRNPSLQGPCVPLRPTWRLRANCPFFARQVIISSTPSVAS